MKEHFHVLEGFGPTGATGQETALDIYLSCMNVLTAHTLVLAKDLKKKPENRASVISKKDPVMGALLRTKDRNDREVLITQQQFGAKTWGRLRNARIIEVPQKLVMQLHVQADRFTTEVIAGMPFEVTLEEAEKLSQEGHDHYVEDINDAGSKIEFPKHLPFEQVFLVYPRPVLLPEASRTIRDTSWKDDEVYLIGHLVSFDGDVIEFLWLDSNLKRAEPALAYHPCCAAGRWQSPLDLTPWIIPAIIDMVNDHKVVVEQTFKDRFEFKKKAKKKDVRMTIPPPYYKITLEEATIKKSAEETWRRMSLRKRHQFEHRFDVRGHERCRILRGEMPIDEKVYAKLEKRGYKIFTSGQLDLNTYRLLLQRGLATKRPNEWLAIKTSWVEAHLRGPEDKPYIPAIRRLPGRRPVTGDI